MHEDRSSEALGDTWDTMILAGDNPQEVEGSEPRRLDVEATIILIAHPEHKLLGKRYRISPGEHVRIGRSLQADLSFPEIRAISRLHAELRHLGSTVTIEDLGSTNHIYVNNQRIEHVTNLTSGDRFQVGNLHFKFLHELDIENAYHKVIYDLGQRDGLTEILNRRKFDEELERECYRALRFARPVALASPGTSC